MPTPKSPAVIAFEIEQATKREEADDFDAGLQATFPASDPVSATAAGMPAGEANRKTVGDADAPRVDEALNAILAHRNDPYVETREQAAALQEEARSLGFGDRMSSQAPADKFETSRCEPSPWLHCSVLFTG